MTEVLEHEKRERLYRVRRVAQQVRRRRRSARLSQPALAKMAGMSFGRLREIETVMHVPTDDDLAALAGALGCTSEDLEG